MRVLLVGEGRNELGREPERNDEPAGALEILVRRLGLSDVEIKFDWANRRDLHAHHGKGRGFFKRALQWMKFAQQQDFDALILVIDQDKRRESIQEFNNAQDDILFSIRRALGIAIRTFDAWMLSDETALTTVLGQSTDRQSDPETIPDPKRVCGELLDNSLVPMGRSAMYAAIAVAIDLDILETRCSKGFAPFAQRVRNLSRAIN